MSGQTPSLHCPQVHVYCITVQSEMLPTDFKTTAAANKVWVSRRRLLSIINMVYTQQEG